MKRPTPPPGVEVSAPQCRASGCVNEVMSSTSRLGNPSRRSVLPTGRSIAVPEYAGERRDDLGIDAVCVHGRAPRSAGSMRGQRSPAARAPAAGTRPKCNARACRISMPAPLFDYGGAEAMCVRNLRFVSQQDGQDLRESFFGSLADSFATCAGQWVLHQNVMVIRESAPSGHAFSRSGERFRAQDDGGNAQLLEFCGVVQTAPRAGPSIAHRRDHDVRVSGQFPQLLPVWPACQTARPLASARQARRHSVLSADRRCR